MHDRTFVLRANAKKSFLTNFHRNVALSGYLQFSLEGKNRCTFDCKNLIGYSQCGDRVTNNEGKKTATGYISDSFA